MVYWLRSLFIRKFMLDLSLNYDTAISYKMIKLKSMYLHACTYNFFNVKMQNSVHNQNVSFSPDKPWIWDIAHKELPDSNGNMWCPSWNCLLQENFKCVHQVSDAEINLMNLFIKIDYNTRHFFLFLFIDRQWWC